MPWSIHERDGKFCVVKDADGSVVHCHPTREKALAQQRALYANEPSVSASLELDTNALFEEFQTNNRKEYVIPQAVNRIEVDSGSAEIVQALTAALEAMVEKIIATEEKHAQTQALFLELIEQMEKGAKKDREALTAAISRIAAAIPQPESPPPPEPPVVNVTMPEPVVNVTPPQVHVTVEAPQQYKRVLVERDPLTGLISSASVEEVNE